MLKMAALHAGILVEVTEVLEEVARVEPALRRREGTGILMRRSSLEVPLAVAVFEEAALCASKLLRG